MLGKLQVPPNLLDVITRAGLKELPYDFQAAEQITSFPELTRHDPFDRMLLGQAASQKLQFLTTDQILLKLGLSYVIDACQ